jgi:DNA (cytosine-5)-methyltransferase 1
MKPPYRVPLMTEIKKIPWNGHTAASLFAGCGGSCLGLRMAGFKVLWANEFVADARDSYAANHPSAILDPRDIRHIKPKEILTALKLGAGDLDVLNGSPPCQSFSTAGIQEKGWNKVSSHGDGSVQRADDLFFEFTRILKGIQPKAFIAENVSGLVKGVSIGYFKEILAALKACGYVVEVRLLDAQWLGVPQMRQRVIFQGIRKDLKGKPLWPIPFKYRYSVRDAIGPGLIKAFEETGGDFSYGDCTNGPSETVRAGGVGHLKIVEDQAWLTGKTRRDWNDLKSGETHPKHFTLSRANANKPSPAIAVIWGQSTSIHSLTHPNEPRKFSIAELKRICSFPDDFILTGSYGKQWARLGNSVPPLMMMAIAMKVREIF